MEKKINTEGLNPKQVIEKLEFFHIWETRQENINRHSMSLTKR